MENKSSSLTDNGGGDRRLAGGKNVSRYFNISIFFNNASARIFTWLNREYADVRWEHVSAAAECPPTIRPISELHRDEKSPSVTSLACSSSRNRPFVTLQKGTNNTARLLSGGCPALSLFLPHEKKNNLRAALCSSSKKHVEESTAHQFQKK